MPSALTTLQLHTDQHKQTINSHERLVAIPGLNCEFSKRCQIWDIQYWKLTKGKCQHLDKRNSESKKSKWDVPMFFTDPLR